MQRKAVSESPEKPPRNEEDLAVDPVVKAKDEAPADAEPVEDERSELEVLRDELAQAKDQALRGQAELDNFRKRAARQAADDRKYAQVPLIGDLLPVFDNVGRAIEAAEKAGESPQLLEGFKMVATQMADVLKQHNCTEIEALGQVFDPHLHEAISQLPSDEYEPGTVSLVTRAGYVVHDRVVRPSQVIVAAEPSQPDA
jgi:molecular chaperone GrpE